VTGSVAAGWTCGGRLRSRRRPPIASQEARGRCHTSRDFTGFRITLRGACGRHPSRDDLSLHGRGTRTARTATRLSTMRYRPRGVDARRCCGELQVRGRLSAERGRRRSPMAGRRRRVSHREAPWTGRCTDGGTGGHGCVVVWALTTDDALLLSTERADFRTCPAPSSVVRSDHPDREVDAYLRLAVVLIDRVPENGGPSLDARPRRRREGREEG